MDKIDPFLLPRSFTQQTLIAKLSDTFYTRRERLQFKKIIFYDTFDWRLLAKKLVLQKDGDDYKLRKFKRSDAIANETLTSRSAAKFWWDFSDAPLQAELKSCLSVRALLPLATIEKQIRSIRVLNADEKTVARLHLEKIYLLQGRRKTVVNSLKVEPIRGYGRECQQVRKMIAGLGLQPIDKDEMILSAEANGKIPGGYSSKINIQLEADLPAATALKQVFAYLLDVIKKNENGIIKNIDSEFLHDFRVAVRRTRSALTQIKGVFPKDKLAPFNRDFATLGKWTGRLRDLDVYLLKKEEYFSMLPEELRTGLEPMLRKFELERDREQRILVKRLGSISYKQIVQSWTSFLNSENDTTLTNSNKPIFTVAKKFIHKKYRDVINFGSKITEDSPDEELHQHRIECKKLRYLLEFFTSLFPKNKMDHLIRQLKRLQDNLGNFNDLFVQQESLRNYLKEVNPENRNALKITASVSGLTALLYQKKHRVRSDFKETFREFNNNENRKLFSSLFG